MDDEESNCEKNNINYSEEYLKYGNITKDNSSILEYNEPSLIEELIKMKINELKKKNSKIKKINNIKKENTNKIRNVKLNQINENRIENMNYNLINKKNLNSKTISNYFEINNKKPFFKYKRTKNNKRCLSMSNIYFEQNSNSYVKILKCKIKQNNLSLIKKSKKHNSFEIQKSNNDLDINLSFKKNNQISSIKSLSLVIETFPHEQKDINNLLISVLNAEKSTNNYLYKNINNYIFKINKKIHCLNELSSLFQLWKNTKISNVIQKRVLDYILSKKSFKIIEIINKEISGLKQYNDILFKNNILKYIKGFEEEIYRNNNDIDYSYIKNVILDIKDKEGIDIIWNGLKLEWFIKN